MRTKKTAREYAGEIRRLKTDIRYLQERMNLRGIAQFCVNKAYEETYLADQIMERAQEIKREVAGYTADELIAYWNKHRKLPPRKPDSQAAD